MSSNPHPLKPLLEKHGIRPSDLPKKLSEISGGKVNIGVSAVSNWLSGRNAISAEIRPYLARLLGAPEETFAPPAAKAVEGREVGAAVLGESVGPDSPPLEVDCFVRLARPGEPPLYRTKFLLQVESVDGKPVLIARECNGRDPRTLSVEAKGKALQPFDIPDRVDSIRLGPAEQVLPPTTTDDLDIGATLVLRVPLRAGAIRQWLRLLKSRCETQP